MKKNKNLSLAWFWSYIVLLVGGTLAPLLSIHFSNAFAVVLIIVAAVALGLMITAHVLYTKKRELFPHFAIAGQGINALLVLYGFISEIVLTAKGSPAVYAWVFGSISLVLMILIGIEVGVICKKIIKKEKIIEGKQ